MLERQCEKPTIGVTQHRDPLDVVAAVIRGRIVLDRLGGLDVKDLCVRIVDLGIGTIDGPNHRQRVRTADNAHIDGRHSHFLVVDANVVLVLVGKRARGQRLLERVGHVGVVLDVELDGRQLAIELPGHQPRLSIRMQERQREGVAFSRAGDRQPLHFVVCSPGRSPGENRDSGLNFTDLGPTAV